MIKYRVRTGQVKQSLETTSLSRLFVNVEKPLVYSVSGLVIQQPTHDGAPAS
jgi:hypothetical protein